MSYRRLILVILCRAIQCSVAPAAPTPRGPIRQQPLQLSSAQRSEVMRSRLETMRRTLNSALAGLNAKDEGAGASAAAPRARLGWLEKEVSKLLDEISVLRGKHDRAERFETSELDKLEAAVADLDTRVQAAMRDTMSSLSAAASNDDKKKKKGGFFSRLLGRGGDDKYDELVGTVAPGRDRLLFEEATNEARNDAYETSRALFGVIINTYPDSVYLPLAKLAIADTFYLEGTTSALTLAGQHYQDWVTFFPTHALSDDVCLKMGEVEMRRMGLANRDISPARKAEQRLKFCLQQFPKSSLRPDIELRLAEVQENLADYEKNVGDQYYNRFYQGRANNLKGAQSRYREVVERYKNYSGMAEVLFRYATTYMEEEEPDEATKYFQQLVRRHPNSEYAEKAKEKLAAIGAQVPEPDQDALNREEPRGDGMIGGIMREISGVVHKTVVKDGVIISQSIRSNDIIASVIQSGDMPPGDYNTTRPAGRVASAGGILPSNNPPTTAAGVRTSAKTHQRPAGPPAPAGKSATPVSSPTGGSHTLRVETNVSNGVVTLSPGSSGASSVEGRGEAVIFNGLRSGHYTVTVRSEGYLTETLSLNLHEDQALQIIRVTLSPILPSLQSSAMAVTGAISDISQAGGKTSGIVERYPTIGCPDEVTVGHEFGVEFSLTTTLISPEAIILSENQTPSKGLALPLPDKTINDKWQIDVVLTAPDFVFRSGANTAVLELPRAGDSTPVVFHVSPKPTQVPSKKCRLNFTLWHRGNFIGKVAREVVILNPVTSPSPASRVSIKQPNSDKSAARKGPSPDSLKTLAAVSKVNSPPTPPGNHGKSDQPNVQPSEPDEDSSVTDELTPSPVLEAQDKPPGAIELNLTLEAPDLTVLILSDKNSPDELNVIINARNNLIKHLQGNFSQPADFSVWLVKHYGKFSNISPRSSLPLGSKPGSQRHAALPKKEAIELMRGFGRRLYKEFAPPAFKEAFWTLSRLLGPRFKTIQIVTDNPAIPWELMLPSLPNGSREREFLGVDFIIARLPVTRNSSRIEGIPQHLPIDDLVVIAPEYKDNDILINQVDELRALKEVPGFRQVRGKIESVRQIFQNFPRGIIHFAGHGVMESDEKQVATYSIKLEDGSLDLTRWNGMIPPTPSLNHPLVFFNACDLGHSQRVANFLDGWAPSFLDAGASGYIGALWPIGDKGAADFGINFYRTLKARLGKGPVSVGEVLRQTRKKFFDNGDPTFLSYVYYGDSNLTFVRSRTPK